MTLRLDQVADLVRIIDASACDEMVLETGDLKLVMRRRGAGASASPAPGQGASAGASGPVGRPSDAAAAPDVPAAKPAGGASAPSRPGGAEVRAPMVGTFYRSPSPDAPAFVELGARVEIGQPLCIIEVMKLFTTIFAERAGTVAEIGAENGELVDYGRVLFVMSDG